MIVHVLTTRLSQIDGVVVFVDINLGGYDESFPIDPVPEFAWKSNEKMQQIERLTAHFRCSVGSEMGSLSVRSASND